MNKWLIASCFSLYSLQALANKYDVVVVGTAGGNASHITDINDSNVFVGASRRALDLANDENEDDEDFIEFQGYMHTSAWSASDSVIDISADPKWDLDAELGYDSTQRSTFTYAINANNWVVGFGKKRVLETDGNDNVVDVPFYFDGTNPVEKLKDWTNTDLDLTSCTSCETNHYVFTEEYYNRDGRFLDINNQNQITGWLTVEFEGLVRQRAMIYDLNKADASVKIIDFNQIVDNRDNRDADSKGLAINESGHVVGSVNLEHANEKVFEHAFYYDGEQITLLPTWEGRTEDDELDSFAYDVNNNGLVVGNAVIRVDENAVGRKTDIFQAYYYQQSLSNEQASSDALQPIEIPADKISSLHEDDYFSKAIAVDDKGNILGSYRWASEPLRSHAFLYNVNTKVFTDLNDLVDCGADGKPVFELTEASAINAQGVISGVMLYRDGVTDSPESRGFLLVPNADGQASPCDYQQILRDEEAIRAENLGARDEGGGAISPWMWLMLGVLTLIRRVFPKVTK